MTGTVALTHGALAKLAPTYESMRRAIAECSQVDEIARIGDLSVAAQAYYRQSQDKENEIVASRIRVRAERRMGEILRDMRDNGERVKAGDVRPNSDSNAARLSDLGIPRDRASRAQRLAELPVEEFEAALAEAVVAEPRRMLQDRRRQGRVEEVRESAMLTGRYPVIYADPPWQYDFSPSDSRRIENQYPTMTRDDLAQLPVASIAAEDAVLFLWATPPKVAEALALIEAWGFAYRTGAVWVKPSIGMGYWFREQHEHILVGVRGSLSPPAPASRVSSVFRTTERLSHSEKPSAIRDAIARMLPDLPRIELFARERVDGWDRWGNEAPV